MRKRLTAAVATAGIALTGALVMPASPANAAGPVPCSPDACDARLCTTSSFTIYGNVDKAFYLYGANDYERGWHEYVWANSTPIATYDFTVAC